MCGSLRLFKLTIPATETEIIKINWRTLFFSAFRLTAFPFVISSRISLYGGHLQMPCHHYLFVTSCHIIFRYIEIYMQYSLKHIISLHSNKNANWLALAGRDSHQYHRLNHLLFENIFSTTENAWFWFLPIFALWLLSWHFRFSYMPIPALK